MLKGMIEWLQERFFLEKLLLIPSIEFKYQNTLGSGGEKNAYHSEVTFVTFNIGDKFPFFIKISFFLVCYCGFIFIPYVWH